jgi:hypothetical protein
MGVGVAWFARDISRRVAAVREVKRELAARSASAEERALLARAAAAADAALPALMAMLPAYDDLLNVPRELGVIARRRGLEFGFTFGGTAEGSQDAPAATAFVMTGKGALADWVAFLRDIERGALFTALHDITITSADGARYEITAHGSIFSR